MVSLKIVQLQAQTSDVDFNSMWTMFYLLQLCGKDFTASRGGGGKDAEAVHLSAAALYLLHHGPL